MKKILFILAALFCINPTSTVTAATDAVRYQVSIATIITYHYYENTVEVATSTAAGTPQVIEVWANSPYEAEQAAIKECSTMCQNTRKNEGYRMYNGKRYECISEKSVYSVTNVKVLNY